MRRLRLDAKYVPLLATAGVMVLMYVGGCIAFREQNFGSLRVAVDLLGGNAFLGVAAVGATFVILSGGIDLSVGSVIAFTTIFVASLVSQGLHPLPAMGLALAAGTAFGALQGLLVAAFRIPPFLVTLAGMFFARGLGFVVHGLSIAIDHPFYHAVTRHGAIVLTRHARTGAPAVQIPSWTICFLLVALAGAWLAQSTRFGRNAYAIGSNEHSARLMGVPVAWTKVRVYALAGFCSALAGCVATLYMQSGNAASFVGSELDVIAAVVIGGTLLTGGVGYVGGTVMGVLILSLITTLITNANINSWLTSLAVGVLLLVFIVLQRLLSRDPSAAAA
jgi:simple sugar transport system permease protein